jgi:CheY-like chemotaxis protein
MISRLQPTRGESNEEARPAALPPPQRLALYHRPGSIVLLDDDADFLQMLVHALPRHWNIEAFVSPQSCLNYLQQEPPRWEADFWAQQKIIERRLLGVPLIPQILQYWASSPQRYMLTKCLVVDHLMPGISGLQALEELIEWPGQRVLLTGDEDKSLATEAFNRSLIDQFVAKRTPELVPHLIEVIQKLLERPNPRFHQIWSATLSPVQSALLRERTVAEDLSNFAARSFAEWIIIGEPFGILGISDTGVASYLQLEPTSNLHKLAVLAEQSGVAPADVEHIRAGRCVYDVELQQALGGSKPAAVTPAFFVGETGSLLAGIHRIDESIAPPDPLSYRQWLTHGTQRRAGSRSRL